MCIIRSFIQITSAVWVPLLMGRQMDGHGNINMSFTKSIKTHLKW